ncbi:MAG: SAM-dependent DNA methyltransferase, partial [Kiritimatiellae bacterium]|nr:SAM-dependent DNA methyltransferase [Kiritimatiellia bacterium]
MNVSQKQVARKFVEYWTFQRGSEKGEDQQFWNSLLRDVLGITDVEQHIKYQVPVQLKSTTKFLDAWIPETRVLIEHKSRGVNLGAPQAGHDGQTPYEQAVEYDNARPFDEKARWIVTCNFDEFRIYDRTKPLAPPMKVRLGDLPKEAHRLAFLVNPKEKAIDRELEISVQAGCIVGEIYDALLKQYAGGAQFTAPQTGGSQLVATEKADAINCVPPEALAALNRLCVRLVFCLYAEDADIFPKDCFKRFVESSDARRLRHDLQRLFLILDTPSDKRDPYLEPELCAFPYTNGGLFRDAAESDIPPMTEEIRQFLIGASQFDWRGITPTIFGALFESTLNPETRRAGGMSYTSVENIHKVIDPLFLDDLTRRVETAIKKGDRRALLAIQAEMAALTFLDPACGSGNFLTETYICLRRLENRIIAALQQGQGELDLGITIKVSIAQFHGIEINDFAARVARIALWIAEAQMRRETAEILHREPDYLPLHDYANIVEGNALRMDWGSLLAAKNAKDAKTSFDYIIGNPPFRGARNKSPEQTADLEAVFGKEWKGLGNLDYVTA